MKYYHFLVLGIFGLAAAGCAQNSVKPEGAIQQSFPEGSVVRAVQSGLLGSTLSEEDLTALEKRLATVHPRKPGLDQWTTPGGHHIRIDHANFGRRQNGLFCMNAAVFVDEKEALAASPLCKQRGSWMIVSPSELAAVPEKSLVAETVKKPIAKSRKKTRVVPTKASEKAYILN